MLNEPTGLPIELVTFLRNLLDIDIFIETGTGLGRTANIAKDIFKYVYTIEACHNRHLDALERFRDTNVMCLIGVSPQALSETLEMIEHGQSVVFLDAHCSYREPVTDNCCPLLDEIEVVRQSNEKHVIIIDDQHTFTSVPYNLKHRDDYPELPQVVNALWQNGLFNSYIIIESKCIVAMPGEIRQDVDIFLHGQKYGSS